MKLLFLILAVLCFCLATFGIDLFSISIGWAGLLFFALSSLPLNN